MVGGVEGGMQDPAPGGGGNGGGGGLAVVVDLESEEGLA